MKSRTDLHQQELKHFANEAQSTHNIAAQATAARLLLLLESRYAALLGAGEPSMDAQKALGAYIDSYLETPQRDSLPAMLVINDQPHPVAQMIQMIWNLDLTLVDKKTCLTELKTLVNKHPESSNWTMTDAQWCLNAFYNRDTESLDQVMASPAKTLSLVCAAMLDNNAYYQSELQNYPTSSSAVQPLSEDTHIQRIRDMAQNLLSCMQRLQQEVERDKCSGGRQHDLLWLLQGSYLDAQGKVFEFVDSLTTFLIRQLTSFVEEKLLVQLSHSKRIRLMSDWLNYSTTNENLTNPLLSLLQDCYQDQWANACKDWMNEACARVGISPLRAAEQIASMAENLPEIGISDENQVSTQRLLDLCQSPLVNYSPPAMQALTALRNRVIDALKLSALSFDDEMLKTIQSNTSDLYTAEMIFQSLLRYSNMLLIGSEDTKMLDACQPMIEALQDYFIHYPTKTDFSKGFLAVKSDYLLQEKQFIEQSHEGVITTFFQVMRMDVSNYQTYWSRIQCIPNLQLSDANIQQLMNAHLIETYITIEEGSVSQPQRTTLTVVTSLSTYDINRLLIHGLVVDPSLWSTTYKQTIQSVCTWLLSSPRDSDSPHLIAVRQSFPPCLLKNILMQTLITEELRSFAGMREDNPFILLFYSMLYNYILDCPKAYIDRLFDALNANLNLLVKDAYELYHFLQKLDKIHSNQVWDKVKSSLDLIIGDTHQLCYFFELPLECFDTDQRSYLWGIIKSGQVLTTVTSFHVLKRFFKLSLEQFTIDQRIEFYLVIKDQLPNHIQNVNQLESLFKLSILQLNQAQRTEIWCTVKNKFEASAQRYIEKQYFQITTTFSSIFTLGIFQSSRDDRTDSSSSDQYQCRYNVNII